jgi:uncharacterized repeat protein (TIGR01451 family)
MKRLLVRITALATVVVLGLIAIAQAQRGSEPPPREFPQVGHANPLRPEAASTNTIRASGIEQELARAPSRPPVSLQAPPAAAAPAVDPFMLGDPAEASGMPISVPSAVPDAPITAPAGQTAPAALPDYFAQPPAAPHATGLPASMPSFDEPQVSTPLVGDRYAAPQATAPPTNEPAPFQLDATTPATNMSLTGRGTSIPAAPVDAMPNSMGSPLGTASRQPLDSLSGDLAGDGTGTPGAASLEGAQSPQLTIEKAAPAEIQVGKPAVFTITLRNVGAVAAKDVEIHDEIPRGTRLLSTTPQASRGVRGELVWPLGTVNPGDEITAEIELMPIDEGEIGSVASVLFAAEASARTLATKPELVIEAAAPGQVLIGEEATLTITVSNPGSGIATGVVLEERVPPGMQHPAGAELEYEIGDLMPNESRRLQLVLTAQTPGQTTNRLVVRGDANLKAENQLAIDVVAPQLDVAIDGPRRRYLEREATYTVSIGNPGTASARNVLLTASLPAGMRFVSANNAGYYDEPTRTVQWQLEELPVREQGSVLLTAMPVAMGEQAIQVRASSELGLSVEKELPVLVEGIAAILFEVVDTQDPVEVGGETTYEIRVLNQGSKAATNVQVVVQLPPEMRAVAAEGPSREQIEPNRVVFEGLSRLAPKADTTYRVRVQGSRPGDLRVRVQLTTDDISIPVTKEELTRVYSDQ